MSIIVMLGPWEYYELMLNVKTYIIGGPTLILMVGLFGSSINAANMRIDGLACKAQQDLDALRRTAMACQFIPKGTFVVVEKPALNGTICVRPLGEINCLWVYEGQVMNR